MSLKVHSVSEAIYLWKDESERVKGIEKRAQTQFMINSYLFRYVFILLNCRRLSRRRPNGGKITNKQQALDYRH